MTLYQVALITRTMSSTCYRPLFLVQAETEDEVWAALPAIGLNEDVRLDWEVATVPAARIRLRELAGRARAAVKKAGYVPHG